MLGTKLALVRFNIVSKFEQQISGGLAGDRPEKSQEHRFIEKIGISVVFNVEKAGCVGLEGWGGAQQM